jgi:hypothetical protein
VRARGIAVVVIVLLGALVPAVAPGAPVINVRARVRLQIDRVTRVGDEDALVRGFAIDAVTGDALPNLSVFVAVDGDERMVTTDRAGEFRARFTVGPGPHDATARFLGDGEHEATELAPSPFELGKDAPSLAVGAPDELELGRPLEITVVATAGGDPVVVPLTAELGPAVGKLVVVAHGQTDVGGSARLSVPAALVGGAGDKRVRVSFAGSDTLNPATGEARVRVMATTKLADLEVPTGTVAYEATLDLSGRLVDDGGAGVADQTLVLRAGDDRVAAAVTGEDGRFRFAEKASRFGAGPLTLQLEFNSTTPWRRGTHTQPMSITIAEPRPVPLHYTLGAFAITFLGVVGFALARTQPWRPWIERFRARRRPPGERAPSAPVGAAPPTGGLRPGRPSLMATLKRPADHGFSGTVRDVITGRAVPGARVWLSLEGLPPEDLACDGEGRFEVDGLAGGTWKAGAGASGYVSERFSVTVPHRGELRDVRVDLVPVREAVFRQYREVAFGLLPRPELWGVWTPREILGHVRRSREGAALRALTDFVEEAYFSARVPEEAVLADCRSLSDAARAEIIDRPRPVP